MAGLVRDEEGNLYGTAQGGGDFSGTCSGSGGCGVVFGLTQLATIQSSIPLPDLMGRVLPEIWFGTATATYMAPPLAVALPARGWCSS